MLKKYYWIGGAREDWKTLSSSVAPSVVQPLSEPIHLENRYKNP